MRARLSIVFVLSFACAGLVRAQEDSVRLEYHKWKPSLLRVGYDLARPASGLFSAGNFSQEVSAEADFHSLFPVAELGYAHFDRPAVGYRSEGVYYRIGIDANLIPYDKLRNMILFHVRYARSSFQNTLRTGVTDRFGSGDMVIKEEGLSSWWLEAGLGLKVNVWKQLYIGYSFRLRFAHSIKGNERLLPAYVPGYGEAFEDGREPRGVVVGFHYGLYWTIPFWNKPVPVRKPKIPKVKLPSEGTPMDLRGTGIRGM